MNSGKMTKKFLETRKKMIMKRIEEGKGYNSIEEETKRKYKWKDSDDTRPRM